MSEILALGWTLSGEKLYCFITVPNGLNNRGSSLLWAFHAVVPSVSGPLWPGFELEEVVTSTHCFSSGNLVELKNMRECISQVVMLETLQCQMCLELLLENIYHIIQYHFGPIIYLEYTNLVVVQTVDSVWCVNRTLTVLTGLWNVTLSQEDRVTFLQEAAINGQFKHPNVVKLLGVVTVGEPVSKQPTFFACICMKGLYVHSTAVNIIKSI